MSLADLAFTSSAFLSGAWSFLRRLWSVAWSPVGASARFNFAVMVWKLFLFREVDGDGTDCEVLTERKSSGHLVGGSAAG